MTTTLTTSNDDDNHGGCTSTEYIYYDNGHQLFTSNEPSNASWNIITMMDGNISILDNTIQQQQQLITHTANTTDESFLSYGVLAAEEDDEDSGIQASYSYYNKTYISYAPTDEEQEDQTQFNTDYYIDGESYEEVASVCPTDEHNDLLKHDILNTSKDYSTVSPSTVFRSCLSGEFSTANSSSGISSSSLSSTSSSVPAIEPPSQTTDIPIPLLSPQSKQQHKLSLFTREKPFKINTTFANNNANKNKNIGSSTTTTTAIANKKNNHISTNRRHIVMAAEMPSLPIIAGCCHDNTETASCPKTTTTSSSTTTSIWSFLTTWQRECDLLWGPALYDLFKQQQSSASASSVDNNNNYHHRRRHKNHSRHHDNDELEEDDEYDDITLGTEFEDDLGHEPDVDLVIGIQVSRFVP